MTKTRRSNSLWQYVLPSIHEYLNENPLASCADAARKFNLCAVTLNARLSGEYDFKTRRAARGAQRRAKQGEKGTAVRAVLGERVITKVQLQECRQVANQLIDVAVKMVELQEQVANMAVTLARTLPEDT